MNEASNRWTWLGRGLRTLVRLALIFALAVSIGALLNRVATAMERSGQPAGFSRGLVQGALMPMAFPNLLIGHDVTIYAAHNTGVPYKLGYTSGVNLCGAVFFGLMFRRLSRWKRRGQ
jgi:hypothetical protein